MIHRPTRLATSAGVAMLVSLASVGAAIAANGPALPAAPISLAPDTITRILKVGPKEEYLAPSVAAKFVRDGDTVEIAAGEYKGDVVVWTANHLRIVGVGGRPHLDADGKNAESKAIWVIRGSDTVIENIEFSGARVPDKNGAGIRLEGANLTLKHSFFHDNENGLLTSPNPTSEILIDHCEFARNGDGSGTTHNVYVGAVAKLTVRQSYLHHAVVGHNLKSRAALNLISDNRFADESDGRASYEVEFPNGGRVLMTFNVIQKGPAAENNAMVSYGAEGLMQGKNEFVAKGNTFINQRPAGARFIVIASGAPTVDINSNIFVGNGSLPDVPGIKGKNILQTQLPGNVDWKPPGLK